MSQVADERWYDWNQVEESFRQTAAELREVAAALQLDQGGPAWMTLAAETRQQKADSLTTAGPHWLAKLPVRAADLSRAGTLPEHVEMQSRPSRDEVRIRLPGRLTTAKYSMALFRLLHHASESGDALLDLGPGGERVVVHDDAFELFGGVYPVGEGDE